VPALERHPCLASGGSRGYLLDVLNVKIRGSWDRLVRPVGVLVARLGVTPDAVTYAGLLIQAGAAALIVQGRILAAGLVAILAALSDVLDGAVAKATARTSRFGAFLDSTTDRISDALLLVPIAWLYGVDPDLAVHDEPWVAAVTLAALVFGFLVSYSKARAESLGYDCNVGIMERAERLILIVAALIFDLIPAAMVLLAFLSLVTFLQRMAHVRVQASGEE
jgi:CDP-diacylglycerol--glycerol-3-phosphate 3-phosphatidyltransferase